MPLFESEIFQRFFSVESMTRALHILVIVFLGLLIVRIIDIIVRRTIVRGASEQAKVVFHKSVIYMGWVLISLSVLSELGVRLSALLGAAGLVGIAVGIASQKSLGNIISGFFLVSDRTFEVGDVVKIGTITGLVHSLDLLSIKLRTFDNTLIRIPNDEIISTDLTNITRFPIRRMDFKLRVAYKERLPVVKELLLDIARSNPLCLTEPEPFFMYTEFGSSGIEILFAVWFEKSNYVDVKNSVFEEIKGRFEAEGIEIPFPHLSLYSGRDSANFPVEVKRQTEKKEKQSGST
jgi:small-conductance mechanosensitive channel